MSTHDQIQAARWVLTVMGFAHGQEPGSFTTHLIMALCSADPVNTNKIQREFPAIVEAVHLYKNVEGGLETLQLRAQESPGG